MKHRGVNTPEWTL